MTQKEVLKKIFEFLESIGIDPDKYKIEISKSSRKKVTKKKAKSPEQSPSKEKHPWRRCPFGKHWEVRHDRNRGKGQDVDGHCVFNPRGKDILNKNEIHWMVENHFKGLGNKVSKNWIIKKNSKGDNLAKVLTQNDYDQLIEGWIKYWSDVLKPDLPLDVNLVKALISSESDFKIDAKATNKGDTAQGLMQLTKSTVGFLNNNKNELGNYLVFIDSKEVFAPAINICGGVRWMFRKREILKIKKRYPDKSWMSAVWFYKGYAKEYEIYKKDNTKIPSGMENIILAYHFLSNN